MKSYNEWINDSLICELELIGQGVINEASMPQTMGILNKVGSLKGEIESRKEEIVDGVSTAAEQLKAGMPPEFILKRSKAKFEQDVKRAAVQQGADAEESKGLQWLIGQIVKISLRILKPVVDYGLRHGASPITNLAPEESSLLKTAMLTLEKATFYSGFGLIAGSIFGVLLSIPFFSSIGLSMIGVYFIEAVNNALSEQLG